MTRSRLRLFHLVTIRAGAVGVSRCLPVENLDHVLSDLERRTLICASALAATSLGWRGIEITTTPPPVRFREGAVSWALPVAPPKERPATGLPRQKPAASRSWTGSVDPNRDGSERLEQLPGIGPALARRILEERGHRPFSEPDDLLRVRGIGPKTLERIRPHLVFRE